MMWKHFYHTERRGTVYADVVDLGRLPAAQPATGDELLTPDPWQDERKPPIRKPGKYQALLIEAAKRQPGTATELARRASVENYLACYATGRPPFVAVGEKVVAGRKRTIYGVE